MNNNFERVTPSTYKIELIKGGNVSMVLISFNIVILIILLTQEFLYISQHSDYEAVLMTIVVI